MLRKVTDELCRSKLIIRSGSKYTHYVHKDFASEWLLPFTKNVDIFIENDCLGRNVTLSKKTSNQSEPIKNEYVGIFYC